MLVGDLKGSGSSRRACSGVQPACGRGEGSYLDEANVGGLLAEALTADVQAVLADQTSGVGADAAVVVGQPPFSQARVCPPTPSRHAALRTAPDAVRCQSSPPPSLSQDASPIAGSRFADVPLAGALAVSPRAGVPDRLVRHDVWIGGFRCRCSGKVSCDSGKGVPAVPRAY